MKKAIALTQIVMLVFLEVIVHQTDQMETVKMFEESLNSFDKSRNEYKLDYTISKILLNPEQDEEKLICDAVKNGVSLILDIAWSGNEVAQDISGRMNIPYVQPDFSIGPILRLLDIYLNEKNASDVLLMFDNDEYIDQALYFWIDSTRLRMVVPGSLDRKTANRIKEIRPIPQSIAVVSSTKNMSRVLQQAFKEDLFLLPERWCLVFTDFKSSEFDYSILNDLPVTLITLENELCCDFILRDGCECPEKFNLQYHFAIWVADALIRTLTALVDEKLEFSQNMECNVTTFPENTKERFDQIVRGIFNESGNIIRQLGSSVIINPRGVVQINSNRTLKRIATIEHFKLSVDKNEKIESIKAYYRIGITHALPWSYKQRDPDTGEWFWTGYCVDFANKLSEVMNFDFEFVEPESGTVGEKINGTWNGVVGDLARGDTDMAITAIIMTADKEEVIDFVAPYFEQTGITIVMRKPVRKTSLFKFMTVLKLEVWLSIVAALVVTGFMIWFLDKYSPYSARNNKKAYPYPCREFTLKESFWFALTSFTPQGGGEAPKALSGRTLVAAYWLFVVLMLATFTANLAAFLTVERMQAPVQSLEQLARQSRINYTVVQDSETHQYFINMKNAEDTLYRMWKELTLNASTDTSTYRVWDYPIREQYGHILLAINDSNPVRDAAEGFRIVDERLDADFAFIHDSSEVKYEISRNCNFTEVGEVFAEKPYAVAVQQGSHLQDDLSKVILDLQKDRFFEQLQAKYWNHSAKGDCPSTDDNEGITLESLGGVFIATLFGLALAMVTLAGEVIYYRRKGKKQQINKNILQVPPRNNNLMGLPPKYSDLKNLQNVPKTITIGTEFKPVKKGKATDLDMNISHINLYPRARNRITQVD